MTVKPINKNTLTREEFEAALMARLPLAAVKQFPSSTWVYDLEGAVVGGLIFREKRVGGGFAMGYPVGYLHD